MKKIYHKIVWNGDNGIEEIMLDAYGINGQLVIHRDKENPKQFRVGHNSGYGIVSVKSFKKAKEVAKELLQMVPDWSDALLNITGEKYKQVADYVFKLKHPNWR
jgi:hypothetical protein